MSSVLLYQHIKSVKKLCTQTHTSLINESINTQEYDFNDRMIIQIQ